MTRRADPALPWWMLAGLVVPIAVGFGIGVAIGHRWYLLVLSVPLGVLAATFILARRAERAAYAQIAGHGRCGRRGPDQPAARVERRRRARRVRPAHPGPGVPGRRPAGRRPRHRGAAAPGQPARATPSGKKTARLLPNVPVHVIHAGDGEEQVPLAKLSSKITRMRPALTKSEVSEVSRRLRALGGVRPPIPKGVDPTRVRPDRKAMRGR